MSDFGRGSPREESQPSRLNYQDLNIRVDGRLGSNPYNDIVSGYLRSGDAQELASLAEGESAHLENETSLHRCVGLSVEARPDYVPEGEVEREGGQGAS